MSILLIVFVISLLVTFGMLFSKMRAFRKGTIVMPIDTLEPYVEIHIDVHALEKNTVAAVKKGAHKSIMTIIKVWVVSGYLVRKRMRKSLPKVYEIFYQNKDSLQKKSGGSMFLNAVGEYKKKVVRLKQRMRDYEKQEIVKNETQKDETLSKDEDVI